MLDDFHRLDTSPGSQGPFAPPVSFRGTAVQFEACLKLAICQNRERYEQVANLLDARKKGVLVKFVGPFAESVESVLVEIDAHRLCGV